MPPSLHAGVGLAGDDVGVGDHEPGPATQPLPSTPSPQAVPRIFTTDAAAAPTPCGVDDPARPAPARRRSRPVTFGSGSMRPSALRIGPDGGSALLRSAQDQRARDAVADARRQAELAAGLQQHRTDDPGHAEADARRSGSRPSMPSTIRRPGSQMKRRTRRATPSKIAPSRPPRISAPPRLNSAA